MAWLNNHIRESNRGSWLAALQAHLPSGIAEPRPSHVEKFSDQGQAWSGNDSTCYSVSRWSLRVKRRVVSGYRWFRFGGVPVRLQRNAILGDLWSYKPRRLLNQLEAQGLHRLEYIVEGSFPRSVPSFRSRRDLKVSHQVQRQHADQLPSTVRHPLVGRNRGEAEILLVLRGVASCALQVAGNPWAFALRIGIGADDTVTRWRVLFILSPDVLPNRLHRITLENVPGRCLSVISEFQSISASKRGFGLARVTGFLCSAALAGATGCTAPREAPIIAKEPASIEAEAMTLQEAKQQIFRALEDQARGFAVDEVRVTKEKLSFARDRSSFLGIGGNRVVVTFYFDSLGRMDITLKKKGYVVRVWDSTDAFRFRVVIPDQSRANRFMEAMRVMSQNARTQVLKLPRQRKALLDTSLPFRAGANPVQCRTRREFWRTREQSSRAFQGRSVLISCLHLSCLRATARFPAISESTWAANAQPSSVEAADLLLADRWFRRPRFLFQLHFHLTRIERVGRTRAEVDDRTDDPARWMNPDDVSPNRVLPVELNSRRLIPFHLESQQLIESSCQDQLAWRLGG